MQSGGWVKSLAAFSFQYRKRYEGACNVASPCLAAFGQVFQYRKRYEGACNTISNERGEVVTVSIP